MKIRQMVLALSVSVLAFSSSAFAEGTFYVGANGGPLYGTYGCVMAANETPYSECGAKTEPAKPAPAPAPVVKVITDCKQCAMQKKAMPKKK
ncbi:hypothetical protein [Thiothrix eikelboomii]|uniref:Uncharacterized protein n=1 Tax=Thiothrix eikelboomii TaxID=92487 RepID=A0A1T4WG18_9GAMM|nr:hypothetical protein [Thiothrix eikelboomii]SKA75845.1 hypothetical protein SAMN02745130_01586 [Thiothrix eikelboomii]